jgi:short-subunit dehydrogenase
VTGASSGLGREFALALAARGYRVLGVARRAKRLSALADEVDRRGGRLEPFVADLSTVEGVQALISMAGEREVELLVNNAGVATYGPFASTPLERARELVRLNVEGLVALTRGVLPAMVERRRGGVINIASQMAFQAMPYFAVYAASKAFVLAFSEALAEELRGSNVRVTVVAPGFVTTEFAQVAGSHTAERRMPHLKAENVVETTLRAYERGKTVKVAGGFYILLTLAGRFAPRTAVRKMMGRVLQPSSE